VGQIWQSILDVFQGALSFLHGVVDSVPFLETAAWGWAIVLLTLIIRILLLPLAIKQTRSMRAMQALQPQLKELQKKYKVDRDLMKKDPEQYRAKKQKLNEEMMALYQREGANPAASCLPLLAQAPIFIALFWTLRNAGEAGGDLRGAEFYFFTSVGDGGLEQLVSQAGWPGWLLILMMSGTMFWSQRQMMNRNAAQMANNPMAQQQKILLYVMPVFLAVISFNFPMGVLLYWVTTNFWQVAQQAIILREVQHEVETGELGDKPGGQAARGRKGQTDDPDSGPRRISPGASSGTKPVDDGDKGQATGPADTSGKRGKRNKPHDSGRKGAPRNRPDVGPGSGSATGGGPKDGKAHGGGKMPGKRDHLPRRGGTSSH